MVDAQTGRIPAAFKLSDILKGLAGLFQLFLGGIKVHSLSESANSWAMRKEPTAHQIVPIRVLLLVWPARVGAVLVVVRRVAGIDFIFNVLLNGSYA